MYYECPVIYNKFYIQRGNDAQIKRPLSLGAFFVFSALKNSNY